MGWEITAGTSAQVDGEANRPGVFRRATAATAGQVISTHIRGVVAFMPSEMFDTTFAFRPSTGYAAGGSTFRFGLLDTTTAAPANGLYLEHVGGTDGGQLQAVCRSAGVQTRTPTGVTLAINVWVKCRIRRINATDVGFTLNDGAEIVMATSVPTAGLFPNFQYSTGTAVARGYDLDYWLLKIAGLTR